MYSWVYIKEEYRTLRRSYETHPQKIPFSRSLHRDTTMVIGSGTSYSTSQLARILQTRDPKTCESLVTPYLSIKPFRVAGSHHGEAPELIFDFY
jgi:hypothetical protein